MENNIVKIFEGQEVKVVTDEGNVLINLVSTAKVCGLTKTDNGKEYVSWKTRGGVVDKLNKIRTTGGNSPVKLKEEIDYILDEIDNIDDRNTIYMSSLLSRRLAMECSSPKAMEYKDYLATLDEEVQNGNVDIGDKMINAVGSVFQSIMPTLTAEIIGQFAPVIEEARNSAKESARHADRAVAQVNKITEMIGLKSGRTRMLTDKLKEKLSDIYGFEVTANEYTYRRARDIVLLKFGASKWEDIPLVKYNDVDAFIDSAEKEELL